MTAKRQAGFTLIELIITVGIIALLSAVAWSFYDDQQRTNRRSDAVTAVTRLAYAMEHFRSDFGTYNAAGINFANYVPAFDTTAEALADPVGCIKRGFTGNASPFNSCKQYFSLALVTTATTFTITATPTGADQALDECASISLNEMGTKGATRIAGAPALPAGVSAIKRCWGSN